MPEKLADMVLTDTELRVTKTNSAVELNLPGISLLHDLADDALFVYKRLESNALPPQLAALLPPPDSSNPQRRILLALLDRHKNIRGMPSAQQQWEMLLFAGRNGIGHLDVFESDEFANRYYAARAAIDLRTAGGSDLWFAFRKFVEHTASEEEEDLLIQIVGPTPGVSGFVPKLMSQICLDAENSWSGKLFGEQSIPAIVKLEQSLYPGLLALEELAYEYHRKAKLFDVPRTWLTTLSHHGQMMTLLASERFDRKEGLPIPQESFFSLLHTGSRSKYHCNTDGSMESVSRIFNVANLSVADKEQWFQRFVMSVLTGNGDLHTENMALIGGAGEQRLSPLYDPAPMRAYRGRASHNILSALPFSGTGGVVQEVYLPFAGSGETPDDLGKRLQDFGKSLRIPLKKVKESMAYLIEISDGFREEAIAVLDALPPEVRKNKLAPDIDGFSRTLCEVRQACGLR